MSRGVKVWEKGEGKVSVKFPLAAPLPKKGQSGDSAPGVRVQTCAQAPWSLHERRHHAHTIPGRISNHPRSHLERCKNEVCVHRGGAGDHGCITKTIGELPSLPRLARRAWMAMASQLPDTMHRGQDTARTGVTPCTTAYIRVWGCGTRLHRQPSLLDWIPSTRPPLPMSSPWGHFRPYPYS